MSKVDDLLNALSQNINNWTCAACGSNSGQPAATFRELKKRGYKFEEVSPNRWGKEFLCEKCGVNRTHYKLLEANPVFIEKKRITITKSERKRIIAILNNKDAFTGASISSVAEIDHKIPWTRLTKDIDSSTLSDAQIKEHFQLLTREHNLLKDRMCGFCKENNFRKPLFGINFWYDGDSSYNGSCIGCGWYDGAEWIKQLNILLKQY